jgi:hypothetical protein
VGTGGPSFDIACLSPRASSYLGYFHHDVGLLYRKWSGQVSASAEPIEWQLSRVGEDFLYGFKPGRHAVRTRRHCIRLALAPAPLRERAGRLARSRSVREREARILRSRSPVSSPLCVPPTSLYSQ